MAVALQIRSFAVAAIEYFQSVIVRSVFERRKSIVCEIAEHGTNGKHRAYIHRFACIVAYLQIVNLSRFVARNKFGEFCGYAAVFAGEHAVSERVNNAVSRGVFERFFGNADALVSASNRYEFRNLVFYGVVAPLCKFALPRVATETEPAAAFGNHRAHVAVGYYIAPRRRRVFFGQIRGVMKAFGKSAQPERTNDIAREFGLLQFILAIELTFRKLAVSNEFSALPHHPLERFAACAMLFEHVSFFLVCALVNYYAVSSARRPHARFLHLVLGVEKLGGIFVTPIPAKQHGIE